MKILRSPDAYKPFIFQLCTIAAGTLICLTISFKAALILLGTALLMLIFQGIYLSKHIKSISQLCGEIDKILHGADKFVFDEFQEGELGILSSEIHKMTVRLREQNSVLRKDKQFMKEALEDMSHQLRTPLTTMLVILDIMRGKDITAKQQNEYIRELCGLLSGMQWKLETMLNLSRLEAGAVTFRSENISVCELIKSALGPIEVSIELKNISIDINIDGEPTFCGDRQYCTEAVTNILKNCMEHTPSGGTITIHAYENIIFTEINISDNGNGIAQKDLPHIFERFYRGSDLAKNGYGIGLAFAYRIAAAQNGSLKVRNAVPHGAEFELRMYKSASGGGTTVGHE